MVDNLHIKRPQDVLRINIHEPWEVNWWTRELGVTKDQLAAAVRAVGVMAANVRAHLRK
jgi:hypothetical protein